MIDFTVAWDKIAQFETANEIANFFRSEGIKASCGLSTSCAIAKWITKTTGQRVGVSRMESWIEPFNENNTTKHTGAMLEFVYQFDHGAYPDLINRHYPGIISE